MRDKCRRLEGFGPRCRAVVWSEPVPVVNGNVICINRAVFAETKSAEQIVEVVVCDHIMSLGSKFMEDAPEKSEQLVGRVCPDHFLGLCSVLSPSSTSSAKTIGS